MTSKEFEAYRTEVARLESEMRESKKRQVTEVNAIVAERDRQSATLKIEKGKFLREIAERQRSIQEDAINRRMEVECREKEVRFRLSTSIAQLKHDFECRITGVPDEAVPYETSGGKAAAL